MFGNLHLITNWLLIVVVLAGQLPALIHSVECVHCCAAGIDSRDEAMPTVSAHCLTCCCKSSLATGRGIDCGSVNPDHKCDDCTICQSLMSTNGFIGLSNEPISSEVLQTELLFQEQVAPELSRFGISQSRAPPSFSA
jgi:hypothetical protein